MFPAWLESFYSWGSVLIKNTVTNFKCWIISKVKFRCLVLSAWDKLISSNIPVSFASVTCLWAAFIWKLSNSAVWLDSCCLHKNISAKKYFRTLNRQSYKLHNFIILAVIWDAFRCISHIGDMSYFKLQPQLVSEKIYKKTKQSSCPQSKSYCLLRIQWFKKSPVWIWLKYHMLVLGQPNIFTVVSSLQDSAKDLNLIPCFVYLTKQRAMLMPV